MTAQTQSPISSPTIVLALPPIAVPGRVIAVPGLVDGGRVVAVRVGGLWDMARDGVNERDTTVRG
jgi:hypothetical protein